MVIQSVQESTRVTPFLPLCSRLSSHSWGTPLCRSPAPEEDQENECDPAMVPQIKYRLSYPHIFSQDPSFQIYMEKLYQISS